MRIASLVLLGVFLLAACASAQEPKPAPHPEPSQTQNSAVEALSQKLLEEINDGLKWRTRALAEEAEIRDLEARLDTKAEAAGSK